MIMVTNAIFWTESESLGAGPDVVQRLRMQLSCMSTYRRLPTFFSFFFLLSLFQRGKRASDQIKIPSWSFLSFRSCGGCHHLVASQPWFGGAREINFSVGRKIFNKISFTKRNGASSMTAGLSGVKNKKKGWDFVRGEGFGCRVMTWSGSVACMNLSGRKKNNKEWWTLDLLYNTQKYGNKSS